MRRPQWRAAMLTAVSGALSLALLAGCASRHHGVSAGDDAARYLQNARGRYVIPGPASDPWGPYIREASTRFDMPDTWIRALMRQESGGNLYRNGRLITSSAGAMGLMQVMPGTYRELRARHNLGPDPFDPHDNILAGVGYMREMYDIYGAPGFLAAYNAGPNRLDDYLANQRGLPDETRKYVAAIGPSLRHASPRVRSPAEQYAMNQLPLYIPPGPRYGYGAVQVPTVQIAAATTSFTAPAQPAYTPAPQPRVLAFAEPPKPVVYAPSLVAATVPQPRVLAWAEPPRPVYYTPAPVRVAAQPPPRRVAVAHVTPRYAASTRVALAVPPTPPVQRSGGGLHLISSAVAAEAMPARHGKRNLTVPVSYQKPDRRHAQAPKAATWKTRAQAASGCHKDSRGKTVCGPQRI
ncbi:MAG: lytic transglycosylase [Acetobacteraceae bacterium]|nr:lytic transglycosylase [Acetobacteraceae bacterium]